MAVRPQLPYARCSLNLYPACGSAYRDGDGDCLGDPVATADGGATAAARRKSGGRRRDPVQTAIGHSIASELMAKIDATLTDAEADELARRITDRRAVETVSRELATEAGVRSVQPNFRYLLQKQKASQTDGDPAQYAIAKLRLAEAHKLAHGADVKVAVIDSAIDVKHSELAGSIVETFDAAGGNEDPHVHGTGIADAIVSHARLIVGAPAAEILAIRAF